MKKLLLLFTLPLFFSCSSDDDKTVYLDNRLIEGDWYRIDQTDSIIQQFKNDRWISYTYDKYTHHLRQTLYIGDDYKLTDADIICYLKSKELSNKYILKGDTLSIKNFEFWLKYKKLK